MFPCQILSFRSSSLNCEFIRREYGFSMNLKMSFMSSGDTPISTLNISVTNFCRLPYLPDFDIKNALLDQNYFEWIAFC